VQHPTKAICPILLEDFRKIVVERRGESNFFTAQMIKDCMKKGTHTRHAALCCAELQFMLLDCTKRSTLMKTLKSKHTMQVTF
jgi:hypothetical protein